MAYVRFASVYRQFEDVHDFVHELKPMLAEAKRREERGRNGNNSLAVARPWANGWYPLRDGIMRNTTFLRTDQVRPTKEIADSRSGSNER